MTKPISGEGSCRHSAISTITLVARERADLLREARPELRKEVEPHVEGRLARLRHGAEGQILAHRKRAENRLLLRHVAEPVADDSRCYMAWP